MKNLKWKRDYGDGEQTDDFVLWVNGKPTDNVISGWRGCWYGYINNQEIGMFESVKEAKTYIEKNI